ncbi:MAG: hypothetical protein RhofKO_24640 [Rhodothermales bacterium]
MRLLCLAALVALAGCTAPASPPLADGFADFVEPDFPFFTTTVNLDTLGTDFPARNRVARGLVLPVGEDAYWLFDTDLLRMAAAWTGDSTLALLAMPHVSYHEPGNKRNGIVHLQQPPMVTTGVYPGWLTDEGRFADPRPEGPNPDEAGRGPLPSSIGQWHGVHAHGDRAILDYSIQGAHVLEQVDATKVDGQTVAVRTLQVDPRDAPLTIVLAEVNGTQLVNQRAEQVVLATPHANMLVVRDAAYPETVLSVEQNRFIIATIPASTTPLTTRLLLWRGPAPQMPILSALDLPEVMWPDLDASGPARWPEPVITRGELAPDTAAFVADRLTLPLPNPWRRNVRVSAVDFLDDGQAVATTYEGDVWLIDGIDEDLERLRWRRFASGLAEPMSVQVVDGEVYVFGREGIVRLEDRNGDGEADFYHAFSTGGVQTVESREFPLDMVARPGGGFYLSKGSALDAGPRTSAGVRPGFRAGGPHSGRVLAVSADGQAVSVYADGFREPYLGVHPETGMVTATDQQGHSVPATPLYHVQPGQFYGVAPSTDRAMPPAPTPPVTWIPHNVEPSAAGQVWAMTEQLGPLNGSLLHLSYTLPGVFEHVFDATAPTHFGGVQRAPLAYDAPLQKAAINPVDGHLYMAGFQIWDSRAEHVSGLARLRYTGQPAPLLDRFAVGTQGLVLDFGQPLDTEALDVSHFSVQRWMYERTDAYGSGHFRRDGSPGQEVLPVLGVYPDASGTRVLLALPDLQPIMQMQVDYAVQHADGTPLANTLAFTVRAVDDLDLASEGFGDVQLPDLSANALAAAATADVEPISAERGAQLAQDYACVGCHAVDASQTGRAGPPFWGLYDSTRLLADSTTATADDAYLRRAILEPAADVVSGYQVSMGSYAGILTDSQIESLIRYIETLK